MATPELRRKMQGGQAKILALCSHPDDRGWLRDVFCRRGLQFHGSGTWQEGAEELARCQPQVVLCEATLPDADWKQVVGHAISLSAAPRVIVIDSLAGDSLGSEVLNLGGYDVLRRPLERDEVVRVVALAWQNWINERERQGS